MNNEVLSDKQAQDLFNATSAAIRDADVEKLAALADVQETTDNTEEVDTPDPDAPETNDTPDADTEQKDTPQEKDPAEDKTDKDKDNNQPEQKTELDKLREELQAAKRENHSLRSQAGRVPHVQRRLQELDRKLEELTKAQSSPSSQPSKTIVPKLAEMLKGISESDPELAAAIANAVGTATDEVALQTYTRDLETTKSQREEALREYRDEQASILLERYPNAPEVFKSPSYNDWKSKQSVHWRKAAESDNADDVSEAFEKYAADMRKLHPELAQQVEQPQHTATPDAAAQKAAQVEAERLRKQKTAAVAGNPNAQGKVSLPDDPSALFEKFSKQIRDERLGTHKD